MVHVQNLMYALSSPQWSCRLTLIEQVTILMLVRQLMRVHHPGAIHSSRGPTRQRHNETEKVIMTSMEKMTTVVLIPRETIATEIMQYFGEQDVGRRVSIPQR
jgi:hypothetical protein